jgi:hypothetical protein
MNILGSKLFDSMLANNQHGFRGMLALVCGYAYLHKESLESIKQLVHK